MFGKEKCKMLKEIRAEIAKDNDIELLTKECTHQGKCKGTCPACEAEVVYLEEQLEKRQALGKAVCLAGLSAAMVAGVVQSNQVNQNTTEMHSKTYFSEPIDDRTMGVIPTQVPEMPGGAPYIPDETEQATETPAITAVPTPTSDFYTEDPTPTPHQSEVNVPSATPIVSNTPSATPTPIPTPCADGICVENLTAEVKDGYIYYQIDVKGIGYYFGNMKYSYILSKVDTEEVVAEGELPGTTMHETGRIKAPGIGTYDLKIVASDSAWSNSSRIIVEVTSMPTNAPTTEPTKQPTESLEVSVAPTKVPTESPEIPVGPTEKPTESSEVPAEPTEMPTETPMVSPAPSVDTNGNSTDTIPQTTSLPGDKVSENVEKYKVTLVCNDGTKKQKIKEYQNNTQLGKLPALTREKYLFTGWYTKGKGGKKVSTKEKVMSDITLYAHWTKVTVKNTKISKVKCTKSQKLQVEWKNTPLADGYVVNVSTNRSMEKNKKTRYVSKAQKKIVIDGVSEGKTYYISVRAYRYDSTGNKIYGKCRKSKKIKIGRK